jgi:hypothetical protein
MIIDRFTQQPNENRLREIIYDNWLSAGETITSVTITSEKISGDADDSGNPFSSTLSGIVNDGTRIAYWAAGGAHGNKYKVTFSIDTSFTQTLEDEIIFRIREV